MQLIEIANGFGLRSDQILLLALARVAATEDVEITQQFANGTGRSNELASCIQDIAQRCRTHFYDVGAVYVSSPIDGIHLDVVNHGRLAEGLSRSIQELL